MRKNTGTDEPPSVVPVVSAENVPRLAYSIEDAAVVSGLSRAFFYRAWRAGEGPKKIKAGKRTLISDESLREWLRSLEFRTES